MKNIYIIIFCLFISYCNSQTNGNYKYYLYLDDFNHAPIFTINGSLLKYSGTDKYLKGIFDRYNIYQFKQAFPEFVNNRNILNVFLVETGSENLISELLRIYPKTFIKFDDLTNKNVEPLIDYYPNDYGITHMPNNGANVSRKELDYQGVPKAWDITKGSSSTIIGISDTAFDNLSPDLVNKLSFVAGYNGYSSVWAHGTSVAALAAGKGDNSSGSVGICMDCNILAALGATDPQTSFENLYKLASEGARVINMSWHNGWGYQNYMVGYRQVEQDIINELVEMYDVVFVGAAGNLPSFSTPQSFLSNYNGVPTGNPLTPFGILYIYPASYDNVISVSSVRHANKMILPLNNSQSTYCCTSPLFPIHVDLEDSVSGSISALDPFNPVGVIRNGYYIDADNPQGFTWGHTVNDKVDIMSTGYGIFDYSGYLTGGKPYNSGTSFSAPIVTGTIGLMFDLNPCLTSDEVRSILQIKSKDIEHYSSLNQNYIGYVGSGKLEIGNTVEFVDEMMKTNGNAIIENHTFDRFNFNLQRVNNKLTIHNVVFRDLNNSYFNVKNSIDIIDSDFKPTIGAVDLKIDSNIVICPSNQRNTNKNVWNKKVDVINDRIISLYPNPNKGTFKIGLSEKEVKDLSISVFDIAGRKVYNTISNENNFEISLPNLPSGIYLVNLSSATINESLKFIKQ